MTNTAKFNFRNIYYVFHEASYLDDALLVSWWLSSESFNRRLPCLETLLEAIHLVLEMSSFVTGHIGING